MRYIAGFLLLANIAYFAWLYFDQNPELVVVARESRPLLNNGLSLVSEYNQQLLEITPVCELLSSFPSVGEARSFIDQVENAGFSAQLNMGGEFLPPLFRLLLPPAASRQAATAVLDSLDQVLSLAEISLESYLITRGALANGIALGVFEDMDVAIQSGQQLVDLGYSPEVEEMPRSSGEIGVIIQAINQGQAETAPWLELTAGSPFLIRQENLCETIAQGTQFP